MTRRCSWVSIYQLNFFVALGRKQGQAQKPASQRCNIIRYNQKTNNRAFSFQLFNRLHLL
jgi:hypothetical protein